MEDEKLRREIYKILGLEFGSLASESGNDWQRAKDEALEEVKKIEFEKLKTLGAIDYLTIDKKSEEFISVINSISILAQNYKIKIAQRMDLESSEIMKLILDGNKDILINLAKYQTLSEEQINLIIPKSVYLVKKYLIEKQSLSFEHKELLRTEMSKSSLNYSSLIESIS